MKKIKNIFCLLTLFVFCLPIQKGYSQNGNSLNQNNKNKNAVGTNHTDSNPKKSKQKVSNNKQGTLINQSSSDDSLPVDSTNVVPAIIINDKKSL